MPVLQEAPPRARPQAASTDAPPSTARLLVVDDDAPTRDLLASLLGFEGYDVTCVATGAEALEILSADTHDLALIDLHLPDIPGQELLAKARGLENAIQVIIMTGFASIDSAVEAMRLGAYDYITKPLRTEELLLSLERALEKSQLQREVASLRRQDRGDAGIGFVGSSGVVRKMFDLIEQVAPLNVTVLITGETGTGKELVARGIHRLSSRSARRFVPVQCSALSPTLLESELFGHVKGSFTGAVTHRRGLFEEAHGGTLMLDEISTIPPDTQVKILRVLQERTVQRVGASDTVPVDFRLIGATNVDLAAEVAAGRFREDLFYRLNVFPIRVPPLRERRDDIPLLAAAFRARFARENAVNPPEIPRQVLAAMSEYDWPGNVRELENYIERTMILSSGSEAMEFTPVGPAEHPERRLLARAGPERWALARLEREYVLDVLHRTKGHQGKAIRVLGISRRTLYRKLRRWQREGHVALPLEGEVES